jgi:hypothetical protein
VFVLVAPVLVYNFLGFEPPSAAGEELRDPARDVPASIARAGALTCALYAVPILAVVLVVPADRLTGLTGFIDALATVFTVYGSWAGPVALSAAVAFLWILVANGLTWVMASSRTQAAARLDGIGPPALGRVSARTGTPLAATLVAGLVATFTTAAAFAVAGDDNGRYFSAALTLSIALLALANLVVFPALVRLRRIQPDRPRPFRVPGGRAGAVAAAALATGWSAVALAGALWPGLGTGDPDAHLPDGFAGDRLGFTLAELVPLAAMLAAPSLLVRRGRGRSGGEAGGRAGVGQGGADEPGDLGDHGRVAQDPAVPEAGGGDQPGPGPGAGDGLAVRPAGLGVLAVVDQQQRGSRHGPGQVGDAEGRQRHADPALDPPDHAGAGPLAEAEAAGEGAGVGERVGHRGQEHGPADGQAAAHGVGGGGRAQGVGDHGRGRAVAGHHRGQRVGQLQDGAAARPGGAGIGAAVAEGVEGDHPVAGLGQGSGERVQLAAPAAPAVHQVDRRALAPCFPGHRAAADLDLERAARRDQAVAAAAGPRDGEPESFGPGRPRRGRDPLQDSE